MSLCIGSIDLSLYDDFHNKIIWWILVTKFGFMKCVNGQGWNSDTVFDGIAWDRTTFRFKGVSVFYGGV